MNPFFSVIIAVYNREKLILRALESLINQEFSNWEVIIVDDCSTDNTMKSIKPFLKDNRFICKALNVNSGVSKARNTGIRLSKGNYITFLDSDDEYKKNHLSSRYEILNESNLDLLHGGVDIIGDSKVPDKDDMNKMIEIDDCVVGGTFFINQKINNNLKLFDENVKYSEDSYMFDKFSENNLSIFKTNIKTYIYHREVEDSICNRKKNEI